MTLAHLGSILLTAFYVIGVVLVLVLWFQPLPIRRLRRTWLYRNDRGPLLVPDTARWRSEAVFNPAAAVIDGETHLLYRAVGHDGVSRFGYAKTTDGVTLDYDLPYPAYAASNPEARPTPERHYSPVLYPSGGSWGGAEDPRMVVIGDRVYVTFNLFDGWNFIRTAVISIPKSDFLAKRFTSFSLPTLLSKPGQLHKNWLLFPEKINGKFAILHSINPKVEVEYRDEIDTIGRETPFIESWSGPRSSLPPREGAWDALVRGAGPPPLRTDRGWLLFYHAHDREESSRYKLGVMLLDLDDPTHVLYRSREPVLEPDASYENEGKPGVVYACGATITDGTLNVYYGGADHVVAVARAPLDEFLTALTSPDNAVTD